MPQIGNVKIGADIMDGNIAKLFPTPEANPKLYQTKCWEEAYGKDHDITINCSNICSLVSLS